MNNLAVSGGGQQTLFTACPVCGAANAKDLFEHPECGVIARCRSCGMTYARSRSLPSWPALRQANPEPYPDFMLERNVDQTPDFLAILGRIKRFQPTGRLVDIGCGTGNFLKLARDQGFVVSGVEPDPWAAAYAHDQFGIDVQNALFSETTFADAELNVATMLQVMEHLTEPDSTMAEIRRILHPDGLLVVEIPIISPLAPRYINRRHFVGDHALFFTRRTATRFMEKHGFRVIWSTHPGRSMRLSRLALLVRQKYSIGAGKVAQAAVQRIGLGNRLVSINLRDMLQLYCLKRRT